MGGRYGPTGFVPCHLAPPSARRPRPARPKSRDAARAGRLGPGRSRAGSAAWGARRHVSRAAGDALVAPSSPRLGTLPALAPRRRARAHGTRRPRPRRRRSPRRRRRRSSRRSRCAAAGREQDGGQRVRPPRPAARDPCVAMSSCNATVEAFPLVSARALTAMRGANAPARAGGSATRPRRGRAPTHRTSWIGEGSGSSLPTTRLRQVDRDGLPGDVEKAPRAVYSRRDRRPKRSARPAMATTGPAAGSGSVIQAGGLGALVE